MINKKVIGGLTSRAVEVELQGQKIAFRPVKTKDIPKIFEMMKLMVPEGVSQEELEKNPQKAMANLNPQALEIQTELITNMVQRSVEEDVTEEEVEDFVTSNYSELMAVFMEVHTSLFAGKDRPKQALKRMRDKNESDAGEAQEKE